MIVRYDDLIQAMAYVIVIDSLGRHMVFWTHNNPSLSFEYVIRTSQCIDINTVSSSPMVSTLSRTISFPSGLKIRSTSATSASKLHLQQQRKRMETLGCLKQDKNFMLASRMKKYKLCFYFGEEMICMEKIIGSRICAERLTPVMVNSE